MAPIITLNAKRNIYSVSQLNQQSRLLLESKFHSIWVEGEVSNCIRPSSGHYYFTLKDAKAQIRCAFFKHKSNKLTFNLEDGLQVIAHAKVSLYEARGDYQLIIDELEPAGLGLLQKQYELLKKKLASNGLFDNQHKKTPPLYPKAIGVVTSPFGAAIKDILTTLNRRFKAVNVIIYPTDVQGALAAPSIINAIKKAQEQKLVDTLIIARGGGSLEDLWAFNNEELANTLFECDIPVITGIGHEIDFTIADFVADLRAPTPTAAAEAATPNWRDVYEKLTQHQNRINFLVKKKIEHLSLILGHLQKRLLSPENVIATYQQKLDRLELQLQKTMQHNLKQLQQRILFLNSKLVNPVLKLKQHQQTLNLLYHKLISHMCSHISRLKHQLAQKARTLHAISPLATLERGYAIALIGDKVINSIESVAVDDRIKIRLVDGQLHCQITSKDKQ